MTALVTITMSGYGLPVPATEAAEAVENWEDSFASVRRKQEILAN